MPCTLHFSDDAKFMLKITKLLKLKNEQIDRSDTSCAHDKVEKDKVPIQQLTKSETKDKRQQLTKSETENEPQQLDKFETSELQ